jgi:acetyl esterase/lipase
MRQAPAKGSCHEIAARSSSHSSHPAGQFSGRGRAAGPNLSPGRIAFAQGLRVLAVEYRLANDGLSPIDAVEDACAAFAWARDQAATLGIDSKRVAGYGVSAGGHLVAAAATLPASKGREIASVERPNAILLLSPALDMARDEYFTELMEGHGDPAKYSPAHFVAPELSPTLIIQGEEDTIVRTPDARSFCNAAERAGARCELVVYPGLGHLLTRNLKVQYKDFDADPAQGADAHRREDAFLASLGYLRDQAEVSSFLFFAGGPG